MHRLATCREEAGVHEGGTAGSGQLLEDRPLHRLASCSEDVREDQGPVEQARLVAEASACTGWLLARIKSGKRVLCMACCGCLRRLPA